MLLGMSDMRQENENKETELMLELALAKIEISRLREQRDRYCEWSNFWRSIAEIMWRSINETQNKA